MANPTLHLTRIQTPWGNQNGKLMLGTPRRRRPAKGVPGAWEREIFEALLDLRIKADFQQKQEAQDLWKLSASSGRYDGSGEGNFYWPGWDQLILPFDSTENLGPDHKSNAWAQLLIEAHEASLPISYLPTAPPNDITAWPHEVRRTLDDAYRILQGGGNVLYLDLDRRSTAAFLPAALALMGDKTVHPHKAIYGLLHAGLGVSPFHYGFLLGSPEFRCSGESVAGGAGDAIERILNDQYIQNAARRVSDIITGKVTVDDCGIEDIRSLILSVIKPTLLYSTQLMSGDGDW
jgi:hypothetical protein